MVHSARHMLFMKKFFTLLSESCIAIAYFGVKHFGKAFVIAWYMPFSKNVSSFDVFDFYSTFKYLNVFAAFGILRDGCILRYVVNL